MLQHSLHAAFLPPSNHARTPSLSCLSSSVQPCYNTAFIVHIFSHPTMLLEHRQGGLHCLSSPIQPCYNTASILHLSNHEIPPSYPAFFIHPTMNSASLYPPCPFVMPWSNFTLLPAPPRCCTTSFHLSLLPTYSSYHDIISHMPAAVALLHNIFDGGVDAACQYSGTTYNCKFQNLGAIPTPPVSTTTVW